MAKTITAGLLAGLLSISQAASAGGSGGVLVPDSVNVEGGQVYIISSSFLNPDGCASDDFVRLYAANDAEQERMLALALTSIATGKRLSLFFNGCGATPWAPSAPFAVAVSIVK